MLSWIKLGEPLLKFQDLFFLKPPCIGNVSKAGTALVCNILCTTHSEHKAGAALCHPRKMHTHSGRPGKFSYDWSKNFDLRNCVTFLGSTILREKIVSKLIMVWDSTHCRDFHWSSCFFYSHTWLAFEIWRNNNMHGFQSPLQNFIFITRRESQWKGNRKSSMGYFYRSVRSQ